MASKIVVIDDDMHLADMIAMALQSVGYVVYTAYDGQMGLQLSIRHKPDLIVSDVNMPMTNGVKVLEYIRGSSDLSRTPVIFLSGAPSNTIYPVVDAHSRVAFMKKPLDVVELQSLVRQFLEKYSSAD